MVTQRQLLELYQQLSSMYGRSLTEMEKIIAKDSVLLMKQNNNFKSKNQDSYSYGSSYESRDYWNGR